MEKNRLNMVLEDDDPERLLEQELTDKIASIERIVIGILLTALVVGGAVLCWVVLQ